MLIREMQKTDIQAIAELHRECFPYDSTSLETARQWIETNYKAHPRAVRYIAEKEKAIVGYILWLEKGGFRKEAVLELEQIGVAEAYRQNGVGVNLIQESLRQFQRDHLQNRTLAKIEVTTGTDNEAQRLYKRVLGAEPECVVRDLFGSDEVIMMARNPTKYLESL